MTTLTELMKRDGVTATWIWTASVSTGPYSEYEVFDAVFTLTTNYIVGGGYPERRTFYVQGIGTRQAQSRRENGGDIIEPDAAETLGDLLSDAAEIDDNPTFREWVEYREGSSDRPAWDQLSQYEKQTDMCNRMRTWLGNHYDEYQAADRG